MYTKQPDSCTFLKGYGEKVEDCAMTVPSFECYTGRVEKRRIASSEKTKERERKTGGMGD